MQLGNARLIGELCNVQLIADRIIFQCLKDLVTEDDIQQEVFEDRLESACLLMTTTKDVFQGTKKGRQRNEEILADMQEILSKANLSNRTKFLIINILEEEE